MQNYDTLYDIDNRAKAFEVHQSGLLVCLAGPGTGKTFSLLARLAALEARGVSPSQVCYLTFIRAISDAFVDDLAQKFGDPKDGAVPRISTLHSFACRLLRNQGFCIGYGGELFFSSAGDSDDAGSTLLEDLLPHVRRAGIATVPQLRVHLNSIKEAWRNNTDPDSLSAPTCDIVSRATQVMRHYRFADWDHTVQLALGLLKSLPDPPDWILELRHWFVDEFQDFNRAEQEMIAWLAERSESMVVVGDDDQSLYSGRGGSPAGIRDLVANPTHSKVSLSKCYRCPEGIVRPTNAFQSTMSGTPRPMTPKSSGGVVQSLSFKSSKAEVSFLSEYLARRLSELPQNPRAKDGVVCLFPSKQARSAYFEMLASLVPCAIAERDSSPARVALRRTLELLLRPEQRFLQRLLINRFPDLKPRHRESLVALMLERDVDPIEAVRVALAEGQLKGAATTTGKHLIDIYESMVRRDVSALTTWLHDGSGIDSTLLGQQLTLLVDADGPDASALIEPVLDHLLPDTAVAPLDLNRVSFLTMHSSKGLTRRAVVLPGLEQACLPGEAVDHALDERERLFFVALSRSTEHLLLTFPFNRGGNDKLNFPMAGRGVKSSFLDRAGLAPTYHA